MSDNKEKAEEKFENAIREYLEAHEYGDGLLIDWMMVTAQHIPHEDGSSGTSLTILTSPSQSVYRSMGLARYAVVKTEKAVARRLGDDE